MPDKAQYVANAEYCARMAAMLPDGLLKQTYLSAEQAWRSLAEAAKLGGVTELTGPVARRKDAP